MIDKKRVCFKNQKKVTEKQVKFLSQENYLSEYVKVETKRAKGRG